MGGLKTAFTPTHHEPAAREAAQPPRSLLLTLIPSSYVRHKIILLSYMKALSDSSSPSCQCCLPALISPQPIASACHYPGKLFFCPALRGQSSSSTAPLMRRGGSSAPSPLRAQPRTGNYIYTGPRSLSPARLTPTYHSRGRSVFVCIYVCEAGPECLRIELGGRSLLTGLRVSLERGGGGQAALWGHGPVVSVGEW